MANPDLRMRDKGWGGGRGLNKYKYKYKGRAQAPWASLLDPPLYCTAASPQASSTLIFEFPVVSWVSCCYLGVIILIYVCQDDS